MSAQGLQGNREGFAPYLPEVHHVDAHRIDAVEQFFAERGDRVAAFIAEPVIGAGGVQPPAPGYLQAARRLCDEHDALLILDEVITGFGRLGSWFASQHYGVTPDLVTFAKAVTSGYLPLGGVLVGRKVREVLEADPAFVLRTGFTYSGHPTVCAAALENLRILDEEGLVARAAVVGGRLVAGLRRLGDDGLVEEVRGEGAIWAVGLLPEIDAVAVREQMLTRGVLTRAIGGSTIAFCPPLVIDDEDVDLCIDALDGALRQVIAGV